MKRNLLIIAAVLVMSTAVWAQMGGMMAGPEQQSQQWGWGPGMMGGYGMGQGMMGGYGMGPGMMGGYGMGPGMMGGYGMGPGMMGGYGMGPGMMGGYGMGPGMMGGYGMGPGMMNPYNPQMQKFLDETADLRRQLHMKQFDYTEALRNPKTPSEVLEKLQKEIKDLTVKMYEKMPAFQY